MRLQCSFAPHMICGAREYWTLRAAPIGAGYRDIRGGSVGGSNNGACWRQPTRREQNIHGIRSGGAATFEDQRWYIPAPDSRPNNQPDQHRNCAATCTLRVQKRTTECTPPRGAGSEANPESIPDCAPPPAQTFLCAGVHRYRRFALPLIANAGTLQMRPADASRTPTPFLCNTFLQNPGVWHRRRR